MIVSSCDFSASFGIARDQGKRGTCLAFAASDFNRYINAGNTELSVEYLCHHAVKLMQSWNAGDGLSIESTIASLATPGQPEEILYPYQEHNHAHPLTVPPALMPLFTAQFNSRTLSFDDIKTALNNKKAVCLVIAVSKNLFDPVQGIVQYGTDFVPDVLHALLAVGIGHHTVTNDVYILVRNSWGDSWGNNGHAWLPKAYLDTHLFDSFAL
jgi:C1A family cysteine protease